MRPSQKITNAKKKKLTAVPQRSFCISTTSQDHIADLKSIPITSTSIRVAGENKDGTFPTVTSSPMKTKSRKSVSAVSSRRSSDDLFEEEFPSTTERVGNPSVRSPTEWLLLSGLVLDWELPFR